MKTSTRLQLWAMEEAPDQEPETESSPHLEPSTESEHIQEAPHPVHPVRLAVQPKVSGDTANVQSPFSSTSATVIERKGNPLKLVIGAAAILAFLILGAIGGTSLMRYLGDPTRNLEPFPVGKYFDSPHALTGNRFKADLRAEADFGYTDGLGRLMLFTSDVDPRPFAVMIPASMSKDLYFTKGQVYVAELEVKEGALIYANSCRKN